MLMPKEMKYRKKQKGRIRGKASKGCFIEFGDFGLSAIQGGRITNRQIEAARIAMTRYLKRSGKLWIRIFPHTPITATPAETRMGKGKGEIEYYCARVKRGTMLFEVAGVEEHLAREAFRLASHKLPIKTKFNIREV